ncbi:MAG: class I SAM-dependent methyltransferase [Rhodospirillales bacterium]|nr:class I SAM-dependent methyltransferase [Rhodospirillales bacterium]
MRILSHFLQQMIRVGTLDLTDAYGTRHRFQGGPGPASAIRLHDPSLHWRLATNPRLALGEAFMDGTLTIEGGDLYGFLDLCAINYNGFAGHPLAKLGIGLGWLTRRLRQVNPIGRARRNVAHHYDLSDEFYELFLDNDRQYSCGYFASEDDALLQAQENKKRHIAAKLLLQPGMKVLDIGCGWGGMALFLAEHCGAEVLGITLSEHQLAVARQRAESKGLSGRVRFALTDYRQVEGRFDRIVSVGMFEHVGVPQYRQFFEKVRALLPEEGVALLHSIGCMWGPHPIDPWIAKYVFPGGYIPALSEVMPPVEDSGLFATDVELLYPHYAQTLRAWRERFMANRDAAARLYDERFCRMWEYYLVCSEIAFRRLNHMVFQMQLARDPFVVPPTRDYIGETERDLKPLRPTLVPDRATG